MRNFFETRTEKIINFGWEHGRYLDFWSVTHFLTGSLFGLLAFVYGISISIAIISVAGIAILYEIFEVILRISEDIENVLTDIVITTAGVPAIFSLKGTLQLHDTALVVVFISIVILDALLLCIGWKHYLKDRIKHHS